MTRNFCLLTSALQIILCHALAEKPAMLPAGVEERGGSYFSKVDRAEMVYIPGGVFLMGEKDSSSNPVARVLVDGFFIDKYEVSNASYLRFVTATEHARPQYEQRRLPQDPWKDSRFNDPSHPVVGVTWEDATAYCKWAGKSLPTHAQWEKAARGPDGNNYPWGDSPASEGNVFRANFSQMVRPGTQVPSDGFNFTSPVGKFEQDTSVYGVKDLAGNVSEWCSDWFGPDSTDRITTNPKGPATGVARILKGGNWQSISRFGDPLASAKVQYQKPTISAWGLGFRTVITAK
ncbi:MAG: SUMF1/EgtB/PvdO family nonheme iron enzyme [Planctomycetota bacterium]|nr:SUMF1/EgtB/PvdO family nonheme iron enzyme [Planctomycetota bacterium]